MKYSGVRFFLHGDIVALFMDENWYARAQQAGLVKGKQYDRIQVLSRRGGFDEWITVDSFSS
jgi:hypothetical protein